MEGVVKNINGYQKIAYSIDEVRKMLGVGRTTLYRRMNDGSLKTVRLGKRRLVPASELDKLINPE